MSVEFKGFKQWPAGLPRVTDWVVCIRYGAGALVVLSMLLYLWDVGVSGITVGGWIGMLGCVFLVIYGAVDFNIQRVSLGYDPAQDRAVRVFPEDFIANLRQRGTMSSHERYALARWRLALIDAEIARRDAA